MLALEFNTHDDRFHVKSHGNGWAYEVTCNTTGDNLWFQDQDADFLRDNTANFDDTDALALMFEMLAE